MLQIKYFIIFEDKKYFIAAAVSNNWTVNKKNEENGKATIIYQMNALYFMD